MVSTGKIVHNSDISIGSSLIVDEVMLFDNNVQIGYLKSKYSTPELLKLYNPNMDIKSIKKDIFCNMATIDFSRIEENYQYLGLGYVLYFHTAQHLNKENIEFRKSTLVSSEAKRLWNGIENHFPEQLEIKNIKRSNIDSKTFFHFLKIGENATLNFKNQKPIVSTFK